MSPARRSLAAVAVVLSLAAGCTAERADEPVQGGSGTNFVDAAKSLTQIAPSDRSPAPEINGRQLGKEETITTKDQQKVVVLNVWASWCGPCRAEAPDLEAASVTTKNRAQFIGLNTRDYAEAAATAFVRSTGTTYPSIFDPDGTQLVKLAGNVSLSSLPSTLIIDKQGRIAVRIVGPISETTLVDLIDDVAAGK